MPTNSSSAESPSAASTDVVSWQSAFWALVALALNAMTQPSRLDEALPGQNIFPMRCSPLVCAMDTIEAVLHISTYLYSGQSPSEAARRYIRRRIVTDETAATAPRRGDIGVQTTVAHSNPGWHFIVFLLSALPQGIKLLGMQGIPWTKFWGGLYLFSFLMHFFVSSLVLRGRRHVLSLPSVDPLDSRMVNIERRLSNLDNHLAFVAVMSHTGLCIWISFVLVRSTGALSLVSEIYSLGLGYAFLAVAPTLQAVVMVFFPLFLLCLITVYAVYLGSCVRVFLFGGKAPDPKVFLSASLSLVTFVLSILYYRFIYDPTGTIKPSWGNALG
ncbi:MAG: hypothetical protein M1839_004884 [Geoglossum umbratile]|nr:MAG: hypothetical protein M1839_004884 [Geoglossum umbratile]